MTRDEAVARIQRRLGFRADLVSDIQDELKFAQEQLEQELLLSPPWWLLEEVSSASTVAAEERIPVPVDFLKELDTSSLAIYDATLDDPWVWLKKGVYQGLKREFPGSDQPRAYSLVGQYFRLHPTPDAVYNLRLLYYKKDTALDSNIENQWLKYAPGTMIGRAGMEMAKAIENRDALAGFTALYQEARKGLHTESISRQLQGMSLRRED